LSTIAQVAPSLERDGYAVLTGAIPADWLAPLREAFEAGVLASGQWPVPRGHEWRHAQVDLDPVVQRVCRLPALLDCVRAILRAPFFLSQVEGREPNSGFGQQPLHRDGDADTTYAAALAFLDGYGPANGATQVVPGSHRDPALDASSALTLAGTPGEIVVFDPNLLHGGTLNASGAPRRSLLISYALETARESLRASEGLRGVRMEVSEVF
jgi:hypothetical protein